MRDLLRTRIAGDTGKLYAATIFNIILGWLVAKLNTTWLSVDDYGKYAFFITATYLSAAFFNFGIGESCSRLLAVLKTRDEQRQLSAATFVWFLFGWLLFGLVLYAIAPLFDRWFEVRIGSEIRRFAPFLGLILFQYLFQLLYRGSGRIGSLSLSVFFPRLVYIAGLAILVAGGGFNLQQSLSVYFVALAVSALLLAVLAKPVFRRFGDWSRRLRDERRSYGKFLYTGNVFHEIFFHSDKFVISWFLDDRAMAFFGLAYMLTFPLSHFSNALATTLFNRFASAERIDRRVLQINFAVVLISVTGFILLREPIIRYLFSEKYLPSVGVMLPLAMAFGFAGLSKPFTLFFMARKQGRLVRNITVVVPVISVLMNIMLVPHYGITGAAWTAFFAYLLDLALYVFWYYRKRRLRNSI